MPILFDDLLNDMVCAACCNENENQSDCMILFCKIDPETFSSSKVSEFSDVAERMFFGRKFMAVYGIDTKALNVMQTEAFNKPDDPSSEASSRRVDIRDSLDILVSFDVALSVSLFDVKNSEPLALSRAYTVRHQTIQKTCPS